MPRRNQARIVVNENDAARLSSKMQELSNIGGDVGKIVNNEARNTIRRMKNEAPFDTGRLFRNIDFIQTGRQGVEFESEAIDPETKVDYAPIQEHGLGVPARPYFWRNVRLFTRDTYLAVTRAIERKLRK